MFFGSLIFKSRIVPDVINFMIVITLMTDIKHNITISTT